MGESIYDPSWVQGFFDQYGNEEWERLVKSPEREIQLAIHQNAIRQFVRPGDRVLEVGAGAGRFTQFLANLGAEVTVADISQVQLDLNRKYANELGFAKSVVAWHQLDFCDLSRFENDSFDAVVAIGGPLSYVLDRRSVALAESVRVTKPGGNLIFGVMSLWGTIRSYIVGVLGFPPEENAKITSTGDLIAENSKFASHYCHLFRAEELREFLEAGGLKVEFMSASSSLSPCQGELVNELRADEGKWKQLVEMEIRASQEPGMLDSGTHLIAVARTPSESPQ